MSERNIDIALQRIAKNQGLNVIIGDDHRQMAEALQFYRGDIDTFHHYSQKNIKGVQINCDRYSSQIAQKVSEDYARYLFGEDSHVKFKKTADNEAFKKIEHTKDFYANFRIFLEKTYALGNGYIIIYPKDESIIIDFINGDCAYISVNEGNNVDGVVVISEIKTDKKRFFLITMHVFNEADKKYKVVHELHLVEVETTETGTGQKNTSSKIGKKATLEDYVQVFGEDVVAGMTREQKGEDTVYFYELDTPIKWFERFKPAIANNHNINSPYGLSIFANAKSHIKKLDKWEDVEEDEIDSTATKVFVNTEFVQKKKKVNADGTLEFINMFNAEQKHFISMPMKDEIGGKIGDPLKLIQADLRSEKYEIGQNKALGKIGMRVGLGHSYYRLKEGAVARTATEVKSTDNEFWDNIKKHQNGLKKALINIAVAILQVDKLSRNEKITDAEIDKMLTTTEIVFKDNVAIDDEEEYKKDLELVNENMMSKKQFLMDWKNLSEKEAMKMLAEAEEESKKSQEAFFGGDKEEDEDNEEIEDEPNTKTENGIS